MTNRLSAPILCQDEEAMLGGQLTCPNLIDGLWLRLDSGFILYPASEISTQKLWSSVCPSRTPHAISEVMYKPWDENSKAPKSPSSKLLNPEWGGINSPISMLLTNGSRTACKSDSPTKCVKAHSWYAKCWLIVLQWGSFPVKAGRNFTLSNLLIWQGQITCPKSHWELRTK